MKRWPGRAVVHRDHSPTQVMKPAPLVNLVKCSVRGTKYERIMSLKKFSRRTPQGKKTNGSDTIVSVEVFLVNLMLCIRSCLRKMFHFWIRLTCNTYVAHTSSGVY